MSNIFSVEVGRRRFMLMSAEALVMAAIASCVPAKPETSSSLSLDLPTITQVDDHTYVITGCSHGQDTGVTLRAQIKAVGETEWRTLDELGVPCFTDGTNGSQDNRPRLFTQDFTDGEYEIRILANPDTIKDPKWANPVAQTIPFTLTK